jgi:hypothetical protein
MAFLWCVCVPWDACRPLFGPEGMLPRTKHFIADFASLGLAAPVATRRFAARRW